jgi:polyisoprenoid-binding protein YceI
MSRLMLSAVAALSLTATAALAQAPAAPAGPPAQAVVTKDPASAIAGTYKLDTNHASVIARIGHGGGFSYSTVRFGVKEGSLVWNPANVAASKLNVVVDTTPIYTPIKYGQDPAGPNLLNVAAFPTATFVSTSIQVTGPTTGKIMGNLTFLGQTKPVTIDASLVGAGKTGRGTPAIGFTGLMNIKRSDFGNTFAAGAISDAINIVVDGEFTMPPATPPAGAPPAR